MAQKTWERDESTLRKQASFDFECSAEQIELNILAVATNMGGSMAESVGAEGCGKRGKYTKVAPGKWESDGAAVSNVE